MNSTITYSSNTELVDRIPTAEITALYRDKMDMDVSPYFKNLEHIQMFLCKDTGYRFYYPETIFGDASFYEELQKKDFYYNKIHWEHLSAERYIKSTDLVLEVGCGLGYFVDRLNSKGINSEGIELNPKAMDECLKKGLKVKNQLIETFAEENNDKYDVVCSFQVLEHIFDIKGYIDGCCKVLKKGGKLIFAVPNNNPYYLKYDKMHTLNLPPHHAGLWNKKSFLQLVNFFPIEAVKVLVEPLYNRNILVESYLKNKKLNGLLKFYRKLHPGITNRIFFPLRFVCQGKCLLAVYTKK